MKFTCSVQINQPIHKTRELLEDQDHFHEWQDGFESFELISGEAKMPGSKSRIIYKQNGRKLELIETLKKYDLPDEFVATYEHKHMDNTMIVNMTELSDNSTRLEYYVEYTALRGFMPKLMAFLFPGMFKKQVQKWLDQFKVFAEKM